MEKILTDNYNIKINNKKKNVSVGTYAAEDKNARIGRE